MKKNIVILAALSVATLAACSKQETPVANSALPEVNDTNCHPDAIKAMPDDERRRKFAGLCLRRGSLKKGSDVGITM